jgi:hypothetical protein
MMHPRYTPRHAQRGAATLLVALVLMMALTIVTLSVSRTQLVEQRIANNHHFHTRLFLLADSGLARGSQLLEQSVDRLDWRSDSGHNGEVSRMMLAEGMSDINTQLLFERKAPSAAYIWVHARSGHADGSGLQARASQFVRPLSVLSPLGESAPPLVINGCLEPLTATLDVRPLNADLDQAGDALWLNSELQCPPMAGIDPHRGTVTEWAFGEDLWSIMFSVDRDTFTAMAEAQATLPAQERTYRIVENGDLIAGRWAQSVGTPAHPVALYFPAEAGCPGFAPGVQIYGVVFIDADCNQPIASQTFELHGSLMINGTLNTSGALLRLNHIQVADARQTRLRFPVLRSITVPGSWSDF